MYNKWLVLVFFLMCLTMSVNDWPVLGCLTLRVKDWPVFLCVLN